MAERVRETPAPGDNVTDATRRQALRALAATLAKVQTANGEHRAEIRLWKERGIDTTQALAALRGRHKDPDEVLQKLHEQIRMRSLLDMPTIQQDLAALWQQPSLPVDEQEQHERWLAREAGALAGREGQPRESNPHAPGSALHPDWDKGWLEDQTRIANAMGAGDAPQVQSGRAMPARKQAAADGEGGASPRRSGRKGRPQPEGDASGAPGGSVH